MKKVLITGGAGFIAHHIIAHIIKNTDWEIVTVDRLDISGNLNRLHEILEQFDDKDKKRVKIVFHDLKAEINSQIESAIGKPDIILHLAAASHVDRSIKDPISLKESVQPEGKNFMSGFFQIEKSPRKLAIAFQNKIKNMEDSWPQSNKSRP